MFVCVLNTTLIDRSKRFTVKEQALIRVSENSCSEVFYYFTKLSGNHLRKNNFKLQKLHRRCLIDNFFCKILKSIHFLVKITDMQLQELCRFLSQKFKHEIPY